MSQSAQTKKGIKFDNEASFKEFSSKNPNLKYVLFEGLVYDVESYISVHPGGADNIEDFIGQSIDEPFHN